MLRVWENGGTWRNRTRKATGKWDIVGGVGGYNLSMLLPTVRVETRIVGKCGVVVEGTPKKRRRRLEGCNGADGGHDGTKIVVVLQRRGE